MNTRGMKKGEKGGKKKKLHAFPSPYGLKKPLYLSKLHTRDAHAHIHAHAHANTKQAGKFYLTTKVFLYF